MVTITERGTAIFRVYEQGASRVEIRGTFTGWHANPVALESMGDGWWETEIGVTPGDHEFQYLVDSSRWTTDYAASGVRLTRFGSWASLLHVPAPELEPVVTVTSRTSKVAA